MVFLNEQVIWGEPPFSRNIISLTTLKPFFNRNEILVTKHQLIGLHSRHF